MSADNGADLQSGADEEGNVGSAKGDNRRGPVDESRQDLPKNERRQDLRKNESKQDVRKPDDLSGTDKNFNTPFATPQKDSTRTNNRVGSILRRLLDEAKETLRNSAHERKEIDDALQQVATFFEHPAFDRSRFGLDVSEELEHSVSGERDAASLSALDNLTELTGRRQSISKAGQGVVKQSAVGSNSQGEIPDPDARTTLPIQVSRAVVGAMADQYGEREAIYDRGIPGDLREVVSRVLRIRDAILKAPELVEGFFRGLLHRTIERLYADGENPERIVDLITLSLSDIRPGKLGEKEFLSLLEFFAELRGLLETQRKSLNVADVEALGNYYATRNAVGQFISTGPAGKAVLQRAVLYFEEILAEILCALCAGRDLQGNDDMLLRCLEVAANNCGNHLDDIVSGNKHYEYWNRLSRVFVSAAVQREENVADEVKVQSIGDSVKNCLGINLNAKSFCIVDHMNYGINAWRVRFDDREGAENEQGWMYLLSAEIVGFLYRAGMISRQRDGVSTAHNMGNEMLRVSNEDPKRSIGGLVAGLLGVSLALEQEGDDKDIALANNYGVPCLRNVFIGLTSLSKSGRLSSDLNKAPGLVRLVAWAKSLELSVRHLVRSADLRSISDEIAKLKLDSVTAWDNKSENSGAVVRDVLDWVANGGVLPELNIAGSVRGGFDLDLAASLLKRCFEICVGEAAHHIPSAFLKMVEDLIPEDGDFRFELLKKQLLAVWDVQEGELDDWSQVPCADWLRENSILVQSGTLTVDEYKKSREAAVPRKFGEGEPADVAFMVEEGNYQWIAGCFPSP